MMKGRGRYYIIRKRYCGNVGGKNNEKARGKR